MTDNLCCICNDQLFKEEELLTIKEETKQKTINATCKNKHTVEILITGGQIAAHW